MDQRQILELLQNRAEVATTPAISTGAEAAYRRVLAERPTNADALHLLGVLRRPARAAGLGLLLLSGRSTILPQLGGVSPSPRPDAARLMKRHEEALGASGARDAARSRTTRPRVTPRGRRCWRSIVFAEGLEQMRIAAELAPNEGDACWKLRLRADAGRAVREAVRCLRRATQLAPDASAVWMQSRRGAVADAASTTKRCRRRGGRSSWRRTIRARSFCSETRCRRSASSRRRPMRIAACMQLDPDCFDAHSNLALTLLKMGNAAQGAGDVRRDLPRAGRTIADAAANRSLALLTLGDYARGFSEYEERWQSSRRSRSTSSSSRAGTAPIPRARRSC